MRKVLSVLIALSMSSVSYARSGTSEQTELQNAQAAEKIATLRAEIAMYRQMVAQDRADFNAALGKGALAVFVPATIAYLATRPGTEPNEMRITRWAKNGWKKVRGTKAGQVAAEAGEKVAETTSNVVEAGKEVINKATSPEAPAVPEAPAAPKSTVVETSAPAPAEPVVEIEPTVTGTTSAPKDVTVDVNTTATGGTEVKTAIEAAPTGEVSKVKVIDTSGNTVESPATTEAPKVTSSDSTTGATTESVKVDATASGDTPAADASAKTATAADKAKKSVSQLGQKIGNTYRTSVNKIKAVPSNQWVYGAAALAGATGVYYFGVHELSRLNNEIKRMELNLEQAEADLVFMENSYRLATPN